MIGFNTFTYIDVSGNAGISTSSSGILQTRGLQNTAGLLAVTSGSTDLKTLWTSAISGNDSFQTLVSERSSEGFATVDLGGGVTNGWSDNFQYGTTLTSYNGVEGTSSGATYSTLISAQTTSPTQGTGSDSTNTGYTTIVEFVNSSDTTANGVSYESTYTSTYSALTASTRTAIGGSSTTTYSTTVITSSGPNSTNFSTTASYTRPREGTQTVIITTESTAISTFTAFRDRNSLAVRCSAVKANVSEVLWVPKTSMLTVHTDVPTIASSILGSSTSYIEDLRSLTTGARGLKDYAVTADSYAIMPVTRTSELERSGVALTPTTYTLSTGSYPSVVRSGTGTSTLTWSATGYVNLTTTIQVDGQAVAALEIPRETTSATGSAAFTFYQYSSSVVPSSTMSSSRSFSIPTFYTLPAVIGAMTTEEVATTSFNNPITRTIERTTTFGTRNRYEDSKYYLKSSTSQSVYMTSGTRDGLSGTVVSSSASFGSSGFEQGASRTLLLTVVPILIRSGTWVGVDAFKQQTMRVVSGGALAHPDRTIHHTAMRGNFSLPEKIFVPTQYVYSFLPGVDEFDMQKALIPGGSWARSGTTVSCSYSSDSVFLTKADSASRTETSYILQPQDEITVTGTSARYRSRRGGVQGYTDSPVTAGYAIGNASVWSYDSEGASSYKTEFASESTSSVIPSTRMDVIEAAPAFLLHTYDFNSAATSSFKNLGQYLLSENYSQSFSYYYSRIRNQ